jgi:flagellar biosynthesis chaperone FliJ
MKIYYEDEFAKLNDQHTKEISQKNIELTQKESQLTEKDSKIKKLEKQRKHYKDTIDELKENGTLDESTYNIINSVFE